MKIAEILTLAAIPAIALSLTACGKKPAASGSNQTASTSTPAAAGVQLDDKMKAVVNAEYRTYDDKNACWIAKGGDGDYCMIAKEAKKTFRDGVKIPATLIVMSSKGKIVNGALDATQGGGIGLLLVNRTDYSVIAKMPFAKAWDKDSTKQMLMVTEAGKELDGLAVYDTAQPSEAIEVQNYRYFAQNGSTFTKAADFRLMWSDKTNKAAFNRFGANITSEDAAAVGKYKTIVLTVNGGFRNGKAVEGEKVFKLTYNKAKKAFDVPADYRRLMGQ